MQLDVSVLSQQRVIFSGQAKAIVLPGEEGVFEVLPYHKPILSRLITGALFIDEQSIPIHRGIVRVANNNVTIIVEER